MLLSGIRDETPVKAALFYWKGGSFYMGMFYFFVGYFPVDVAGKSADSRGNTLYFSIG